MLLTFIPIEKNTTLSILSVKEGLMPIGSRKVALRGLRFEPVKAAYVNTQLATYIKNNEGQVVGKFVTSGVGLIEHNRRFKAVVKKTLKPVSDL